MQAECQQTFFARYRYQPTNIGEDHIRTISDFRLKQNYPNPFNPLTSIDFQIPNSEFVTLGIYNILGQKVATLVNEKKQSGSYNVKWDADKHAAGVYYYQLKAGEYLEVKKMVLLK